MPSTSADGSRTKQTWRKARSIIDGVAVAVARSDAVAVDAVVVFISVWIVQSQLEESIPYRGSRLDERKVDHGIKHSKSEKRTSAAST